MRNEIMNIEYFKNRLVCITHEYREGFTNNICFFLNYDDKFIYVSSYRNKILSINLNNILLIEECDDEDIEYFLNYDKDVPEKKIIDYVS